MTDPLAALREAWANLLADHEGHTLRVMPPHEGDDIGTPLPATLWCDDHEQPVEPDPTPAAFDPRPPGMYGRSGRNT